MPAQATAIRFGECTSDEGEVCATFSETPKSTKCFGMMAMAVSWKIPTPTLYFRKNMILRDMMVRGRAKSAQDSEGNGVNVDLEANFREAKLRVGGAIEMREMLFASSKSPQES